MVVDSTAQISKLLAEKTCQSFDPLMILEVKASALVKGANRLNTSCKAPAYAYVSGSHGDRFLCDFHYFFELDAERVWSEEGSKDIFAFVVDRFDQIPETFASLPEGRELKPEGYKCWCGAEPQVFYRDKETLEVRSFYCNFHHRKHFYRSLSNNIDVADDFIIDDYRTLMKNFSAEEDYEEVGVV